MSPIPPKIAYHPHPDNTYVYDALPEDKKQSSMYTFLLYLNDECEGGETTLFLPATREGTLNAYPVRPEMGSLTIFPYGEANGVLLLACERVQNTLSEWT